MSDRRKKALNLALNNSKLHGILMRHVPNAVTKLALKNKVNTLEDVLRQNDLSLNKKKQYEYALSVRKLIDFAFPFKAVDVENDWELQYINQINNTDDPYKLARQVPCFRDDEYGLNVNEKNYCTPLNAKFVWFLLHGFTEEDQEQSLLKLIDSMELIFFFRTNTVRPFEPVLCGISIFSDVKHDNENRILSSLGDIWRFNDEKEQSEILQKVQQSKIAEVLLISVSDEIKIGGTGSILSQLTIGIILNKKKRGAYKYDYILFDAAYDGGYTSSGRMLSKLQLSRLLGEEMITDKEGNSQNESTGKIFYLLKCDDDNEDIDNLGNYLEIIQVQDLYGDQKKKTKTQKRKETVYKTIKNICPIETRTGKSFCK